MQHRRVGDLAHHLAARTMIFGNAESLAQLIVVQVPEPRRHGGDAEPVPGAGGVVVARRWRAARCRPGQRSRSRRPGPPELPPAELGQAFGKGRERRHNDHADMALGRAVAVMTVEIVDLRGQRKRGAGLADAHGRRTSSGHGAGPTRPHKVRPQCRVRSRRRPSARRQSRPRACRAAARRRPRAPRAGRFGPAGAGRNLRPRPAQAMQRERRRSAGPSAPFAPHLV